jgi:DNA repair exonuclease SbcCD ATPase subunit
MKIDAIEIKNFLGVREFDATLEKPVTLISGYNGSGKSSIHEAVRMALTGEFNRVALKKDFPRLVHDGEKRASVILRGTTGLDQRSWILNIDLPSGKGQDWSEVTQLRYVLDAQKFARLDANDRRKFLFDLMNILTGYEFIRQRLIDKGIENSHIELIKPMLNIGFEAAHSEAANRARDAKAAWRVITGETYGEKKAAAWIAEKPEIHPGKIDEYEEKLEQIDRAIAEINQSIGGICESRNRNAQALAQLTGLRQKAGCYARFAKKLTSDEAAQKEWEQKLEETRRAAQGGRKSGLVHDLAYALDGSLTIAMPFGDMNDLQRQCLRRANDALDAYTAEHGGPLADASSAPDRDAVARLPEYEKALKLMASSVANDKRDLAEANTAAEAIKQLESTISEAPSYEELKSQEALLAGQKAERKSLAAELAAEREICKKAIEANSNTAKARAEHESVLAWTKIADALAPDGIPGEMLSHALDPINESLEETSQRTSWMKVHIDSNMDIFAAWPNSPPRPYSLLSQSEKWRVDAMIAESISYISEMHLLVLDRIDVLDLAGRSELIYWLDGLAKEGLIETALIFGTLKAAPKNLPETVSTYWLVDGVVKEVA